MRTTSTANWARPSSDPTGITYNPKTKTLLISDAEVDESPTLWRQRNLFLVGRKGGLLATRRVTMVSREPEGIAWWAKTKSLFIADDDRDAIFRLRPGRDGAIGTGDDKAKKLINTRRFGSFDPEGLAWRPDIGMFIWVDATNSKVYKLRAGRDRRWNTKDDVARTFGTFKFGFSDPEGVAYLGVNKHLYIADSRKNFLLQLTMTGKLVRRIWLPWCKTACNISDLVFAPGTDGSRRRLYLTDRGKDNDAWPNPSDHNDGKLYQVRFAKV